MTTRRAFLLAGGTFAVGAAVGGACGYSIGAKAEAVAPVADQELVPSGDVELDELRRLAVKATISELVEKRLYFANSLVDRYRDDRVLWSGVGRLCDALIANQQFPDRRLFSRFLAQMIANGPKDAVSGLAGRREELRMIK